MYKHAPVINIKPYSVPDKIHGHQIVAGMDSICTKHYPCFMRSRFSIDMQKYNCLEVMAIMVIGKERGLQGLVRGFKRKRSRVKFGVVHDPKVCAT